MQKFKNNKCIENCDSNSLLLDSSLILETLSYKTYDLKLVECGEYMQVYYYNSNKNTHTQEYFDELNLKKSTKNDFLIENTEEKEEEEQEEKKIELKDNIEIKNIVRSKLECQRLAKCNIKDWKIFVTLTFAENETNIENANKKFRNFIRKVTRVYDNFKYICIPEFQKRGAIHYHILCNIDINNDKLLYTQEDNSKYKHIKYWNEGFTSIEEIKGDVKKVIGYISKYMTKDIDNRLFNRHRYYFSRNLERPVESYINLNEPKELDYYIKKLQDKELIYQNDYHNSYDNSIVHFLEFSTSSVLIVAQEKEK